MKTFNLFLSALTMISVSTFATSGAFAAGSNVVFQAYQASSDDEGTDNSPFMKMIHDGKKIALADLMALEYNALDNVVDMTDHMVDDMIFELDTAWDEQCGTNFLQTEQRDRTFSNTLNRVKSKGIMTDNQLNLSAVKALIQNEIGVAEGDTQVSAGEKVKDWFSAIIAE